MATPVTTPDVVTTTDVQVTRVMLGPGSHALKFESSMTLPQMKEPQYMGKFSPEQERAIMETIHQSLGGTPSSSAESTK